MAIPTNDNSLTRRALQCAALKAHGLVSGVSGSVVRAHGIDASVGQQAELWPINGTRPVLSEVIGLDGGDSLLMALENLQGIGSGSEVRVRGRDPFVRVGDELLGRIIDGLGRPLDNRPPPNPTVRRPLRDKSPSPMDRDRITKTFTTGVRVVDALLTTGRGQRIGVFAGAGIGKTSLLSMMARSSQADVCVVGLIGERGREVREFVEDSITDANRDRTVVVAVTGDEAPLTRVRGALLATTIAEHFRSRGKHVLLMIDSVTRYAMALREVGLAGGELPASKGYPPSVFMELSRLLERAGNDSTGSVTGIYTVLVEGDDMVDPVADSAQSLLDGHIILSRDMANSGLYPSIDVLTSISRLMNHVVSTKHLASARKIISVLAVYKQAEDLIRIGAYKAGSDPAVDRARAFVPHYERFLQQQLDEGMNFGESTEALLKLAQQVEGSAR